MGDPAAARRHVEALAAVADVVKASDEDLAWLYEAHTPAEIDDAMRAYADLGAALVVVTRGGEGSRVFVPATDEWADVPPVADVHVADTVGAGDSFMSGLISGLLDAGLLGSRDAAQALRVADLAAVLPAVDRATRCAGITVSRAGVNPPTRAQIRALRERAAPVVQPPENLLIGMPPSRELRAGA